MELKLEAYYCTSQKAAQFAKEMAQSIVVDLMVSINQFDHREHSFDSFIINVSNPKLPNIIENIIKPEQHSLGCQINDSKQNSEYPFTMIPLKESLLQIYNQTKISNFKVALYADETSFVNPIGIFKLILGFSAHS